MFTYSIAVNPMKSPLLSIGTFGVHLIPDSNYRWSFAGTVPIGIKRGGFRSEAEGLIAFASWFTSQDSEFQRKHAAELRQDVALLASGSGSDDFPALWCFIGSRLEISDNDAQSMALRLMAKGIKTWEQWVNAGEVIA